MKITPPCHNKKCEFNDLGESGCSVHCIHAVDMCETYMMPLIDTPGHQYKDEVKSRIEKVLLSTDSWPYLGTSDLAEMIAREIVNS